MYISYNIHHRSINFTCISSAGRPQAANITMRDVSAVVNYYQDKVALGFVANKNHGKNHGKTVVNCVYWMFYGVRIS